MKRICPDIRRLSHSFRIKLGGFVFALLCVSGHAETLVSAARLAQGQAFDFSCSVFPEGLSEAELISRYGAENVTRGPVFGVDDGPVQGTILFADLEDRVEITWRDTESMRWPAWIRARGDAAARRAMAGRRHLPLEFGAPLSFTTGGANIWSATSNTPHVLGELPEPKITTYTNGYGSPKTGISNFGRMW